MPALWNYRSDGPETSSLGGGTVVDELVRELHEVLRALGLSVPRATQDVRVLDDIEEAIAPARLPRAARRLWELVDATSLQALVSFYPLLASPEFGLRSWWEDEANEFIGGQPRHFFQFCYESHDVVSVECDGPDWEGGCLFEWFLSDPDGTFRLKYRSVEDWLEVLVAALRDGFFRWVGEAHVMVEQEPAEKLAELKLADHPPHPIYGRDHEIQRAAEGWPAAWRRRSNLSR